MRALLDEAEQAGPGRVPLEVVLGAAEVVDAAVGPEAHGLLEHAAAVATLLADEHHRVVLHAERRVEPAEGLGRLGGEVAGRLGLADRADAPRAVAAPPPVVGGDVVVLAVDLERAAPGTELGQPAGVEERPPLALRSTWGGSWNAGT